MMYNQRMVCCLKANGKVLREFNDTVYVPFGSEYQVYLKNLNSVRALINITIDGVEAVPGGLVLNANQEVNLERFVTNMTSGNRFKFIERSAGVEAHRGVKAEDGLIRVSFKYALPTPAPLWTTWTTTTHYPPYNNQWYSTSDTTDGQVNPWTTPRGTKLRSGGAGGASASLSSMASATAASSQQVFMNSVSKSFNSNDVGITVPGSVSDQKFVTVADFVTETTEHVMILRILGETENVKVERPVTVKAKPKCVTCGRVNKATSQFCSACGTALMIVI
jgi:hypothetical protein